MVSMQASHLRGVIAAGVFLVLSGSVSAQVPVPSPAPSGRAAPLDAVVTSTVRPAPPTAHASIGSPGFESALALLAGGDAAGAYEAARRLTDDVERRTVQWASIRFGKDVDADKIAAFIADAPDYDFSSVYRARLESAIDVATADTDKIIRLLGGNMPNALDAQIALAEAYVADGQVERAARIARHIWVEQFLTEDGEAKVEARLGKLLTKKDYWDRAVHLLMHDRATGTERIMASLTPAQQSLAKARIAVSRKSDDIAARIANVDPSLREHPLFHFAMAQWKRDSDDLEAAIAALDKVTSGDVPDAAEFWYERRLIVRRALADGKPDLAYRAAATYTAGPEGRLVEARFHAGFVALVYLDDARRAAPHFADMAELSTLPDSIAQARYWLGRTEQALGNTDAAAAEFRKAARYGFLFYGQLAREALNEPTVVVRALPDWKNRQAIFDALPLVRAVRLLADAGRKDWAEPLVRRLGYAISEPGDFVLAARLAQDIGAHNVAILIADRADQMGYSLDLFHYPKDGIPAGVELALADEAAVYAVARQESHFDIDAVSRSGARGLMQLMPATAKELSERLGVAYSPSRLVSDPAYNLLLGSSYLKTQLERYDGSLLLAAAAYNAGGGNVNKWLKLYGDPRDEKIDAVSWTELIPFVETRKYVQKVLANYLVYRARLGGPSLTMQQALRQIPG